MLISRFAAVLIALLACSSVFAGELKHKATCTAESLQGHGITTVDGLIADYGYRSGRSRWANRVLHKRRSTVAWHRSGTAVPPLPL